MRSIWPWNTIRICVCTFLSIHFLLTLYRCRFPPTCMYIVQPISLCALQLCGAAETYLPFLHGKLEETWWNVSTLANICINTLAARWKVEKWKKKEWNGRRLSTNKKRVCEWISLALKAQVEFRRVERKHNSVGTQ